MAVDQFAQVPFYDGEGVVFTDFNNMARFADARLHDAVFARYAGALADTSRDPHINSLATTPLTELAYTLNGGDCLMSPLSTNRVALTRGTILQKIGTTDGTDAKFISYSVGSSDVDLTIAAGDPTNPRITILQMKLEYITDTNESRSIKDSTTFIVTNESRAKRRRVQATFSLKNGTPAATPTYPTPDAGYCVVGAIRVPATWTTGVSTRTIGAPTSAIFRQCTVPLRVEAHVVHAKDFFYDWPLASGWTLGSDGTAQASGASTNLVVWVPGGYAKRIVGVEVRAAWATSGVVELTHLHWSLGSGLQAVTPNFNLTSLVVTGGTDQLKFAHLGVIADASTVSNPSAANGPIGDPAWTNGEMSGGADYHLAPTSGGSPSRAPSRAALVIDAGSGSIIESCTFYLAG